MLTMLVPLLAALAVPSPAPTPAAQSVVSPLKEIGHVESLSVCSAIVVHANSAIGAALDDDGDLALTINRLRTTDLEDDNAIKRRNGMSDLATLAGRIRAGAAAGSGEIKRLRAMAAQTADPTRKAELRAFTDALGGALARQRSAGVDLDRMLAIIDGRRAVEEVNTVDLTGERLSIAGSDNPAGSGKRPAGLPAPLEGELRNPGAPATPPRVNDMLRGVAEDFQSRAQSILSDEGVAAEHSLGATTGC